MKTLISAETVRQAKAGGQTRLPAGKDVLVTPEARTLAEQLGIRLDDAAALAEAEPVAKSGEVDAIRKAILAQLPSEAAGKADLVEQIVGKVCQAQKSEPEAQPSPAQKPGGIKLVKSAEVCLGDFPGAGPGKQVGIADVITAADGAPIAAGFMAWSQCFFPWKLDYDEIDIVLEGELHIRCEGKTHVGKVGDVLYIPKGSAIEFGTTSSVRFCYVTYPANWQS